MSANGRPEYTRELEKANKRLNNLVVELRNEMNKMQDWNVSLIGEKDELVEKLNRIREAAR